MWHKRESLVINDRHGIVIPIEPGAPLYNQHTARYLAINTAQPYRFHPEPTRATYPSLGAAMLALDTFSWAQDDERTRQPDVDPDEQQRRALRRIAYGRKITRRAIDGLLADLRETTDPEYKRHLRAQIDACYRDLESLDREEMRWDY